MDDRRIHGAVAICTRKIHPRMLEGMPNSAEIGHSAMRCLPSFDLLAWLAFLLRKNRQNSRSRKSGKGIKWHLKCPRKSGRTHQPREIRSRCSGKHWNERKFVPASPGERINWLKFVLAVWEVCRTVRKFVRASRESTRTAGNSFPAVDGNASTV